MVQCTVFVKHVCGSGEIQCRSFGEKHALAGGAYSFRVFLCDRTWLRALLSPEMSRKDCMKSACPQGTNGELAKVSAELYAFGQPTICCVTKGCRAMLCSSELCSDSFVVSTGSNAAIVPSNWGNMFMFQISVFC